jgi:hypothetical protein
MNKYYEKLQNKILELEKFGIKLNRSEFTRGDRFESEIGTEFHFNLFGSNYSVKISSRLKDSDDWRIAQMKIIFYCSRDLKKFHTKKLFGIIDNYKNIERGIKIDTILRKLEQLF